MNLIETFAGTIVPEDVAVYYDVRTFAAWRMGRDELEFIPRANDDVELRTYFLTLRNSGADREAIRRCSASLKRFYQWALSEGIIDSNPFEEYNLERPMLSREEIRRRADSDTNPTERELARLRALNHLSENLNRSLDVRSILTVALEEVLEVMDLQTGWAFLRTESDLASFVDDKSDAKFVLAAAINLPPGLERDDRLFLRKRPECHCQRLSLDGQLTRAVNVVECSRLLNSLEAGGDNRKLYFHSSVPLVLQGREIGILNYATQDYVFLTSADLELLSAVGAQVSTALERARLYDIAEAQRSHFAVELEMARAVQNSLLPTSLPDIPGFALALHWWFASEVGGDFCDLIELPKGRWGIVVADVSDKGAPAALYMAMARSLLRSRAEQASSPGKLLNEVNQALCTQSTSAMFVTMFYAILDPAARTITYANAGHNPPILQSANGITELLRTGIALGVLAEKTWGDETVAFAPGDMLVAYTDGVTEATNARGRVYGQERLVAAIKEAPHQARPMLDYVVGHLGSFTQGTAPADDITLFIVERK